MKRVLRVFEICSKFLNGVSILALLIMIGVTVADIFLKNLFKAPITGAVEITRMMMVCMTPSFVSALVESRHVNVGLVVDRLGRKGQLAFDTFGYSLSATLCGLMCYQGFIDMAKKMSQNQVYTMLKIPTWPFYLIFALAMGFFAIAIVVYLIDKFVDKDAYAVHEMSAEDAIEGGDIG